MKKAVLALLLVAFCMLTGCIRAPEPPVPSGEESGAAVLEKASSPETAAGAEASGGRPDGEEEKAQSRAYRFVGADENGEYFEPMETYRLPPPELRDFSELPLDETAAALLAGKIADSKAEPQLEDARISVDERERGHYTQGVLYARTLCPVSIGNTAMCIDGALVTGLIYDERFRGSVLGTLGIGSTMADVKSILGAPQFQNGEYGYIGYKTKHFYIAFRGGEAVERIYLERRVELPEGEVAAMLERWPQHDGVEGFPVDDYGWMAAYGLVMMHSGNGDAHSTRFSIWNDYGGDIPAESKYCIYNEAGDGDWMWMHVNGSHSRAEYEKDTLDFPEWRIQMQCALELAKKKAVGGAMREHAAALAQMLPNSRFATRTLAPGSTVGMPVRSPDGTRTAFYLADTEGEIAWFPVVIRTEDGSAPDIVVEAGVGGVVFEVTWFNNEYLCVSPLDDWSEDGLQSNRSPFYINARTGAVTDEPVGAGKLS